MGSVGRAVYPGNTVRGARHSRSILIIGASNIWGNNEGPGDTFGLSGWSPFPTGLVFRFNGTLYTSYTSADATAHGPEMGLCDRLEAITPGITNGLTIVKRAIKGSTLAQWISTHLATAIADCATQGVAPAAVYLMIPNADTASAPLGLNVEQKVLQIEQVICKTWGNDTALILGGPLHTDDTAEPGNDAARRSAQALAGALTDGVGVGALTGRRAWLSNAQWVLNLQSADGHLTHAGQILQGTDLANADGLAALLAA